MSRNWYFYYIEKNNNGIVYIGRDKHKGAHVSGNNFDMEAFRKDLGSEDFILPDEEESDQSDRKDYETYVVQAGDTLTSIAKKFNVEINQIVEWNNISNTKCFGVDNIWGTKYIHLKKKIRFLKKL